MKQEQKPREQVRLYIGSTHASHPTLERAVCPFAILAPSIRIATAEARTYAYSEWPIAQGFTDHKAFITPLDWRMYGLLGDAAAGGYLNYGLEHEKPSEFRFKQNIEDELDAFDWSSLPEN
jgi:hypothetical protein